MVIELLEKEFKELVFNYENDQEWVFLGNKPAIIDFFAGWCQPCKQIAPVLEELSNEYEGKIDIYKVDVDKSSYLAQLFGIQSIPTILFIPLEGQPEILVGGLPKEKFKKAITEILKIT